MDAEAGERAAQEATQLLREENMAVRAQLEVPDPRSPPDPPVKPWPWDGEAAKREVEQGRRDLQAGEVERRRVVSRMEDEVASSVQYAKESPPAHSPHGDPADLQALTPSPAAQ